MSYLLPVLVLVPLKLEPAAVCRKYCMYYVDARSKAQAAARDVHRTLHELYDLRSRTDPHAQAIFHADVTAHQARPTWFNQNWIAVHGPMIRDNVKQATAQAKAGMRSIMQYLMPQR